MWRPIKQCYVQGIRYSWFYFEVSYKVAWSVLWQAATPFNLVQFCVPVWKKLATKLVTFVIPLQGLSNLEFNFKDSSTISRLALSVLCYLHQQNHCAISQTGRAHKMWRVCSPPLDDGSLWRKSSLFLLTDVSTNMSCDLRFTSYLFG